jgi:hypothetical protein
MPLISEIVTPLLGLRFTLQGMLIALLVFGSEFFVAQGPTSEPVRRAPFERLATEHHTNSADR